MREESVCVFLLLLCVCEERESERVVLLLLKI